MEREFGGRGKAAVCERGESVLDEFPLRDWFVGWENGGFRQDFD